MTSIRAVVVLLSLIGPLKQASAEPIDRQGFRQIFFDSLLSMDQHLSDRDFNRLILQPSNDLLSEPARPRCTLCGLAEKFLKLKPSEMVDESAPVPTPSKGFQSLVDAAKKQDLLIVIVPGIFGEFIDQRAFEEVFAQPGQFRTQWEEMVKKGRQEALGRDQCMNVEDSAKTATCADQEMLSELTLAKDNKGIRSMGMEKLIQATSLDQDGQILSKVMLLNVEGMSLESLGDNSDRARIFNERLERAFEILGGAPKNIIFVGYSRGTDFGLDMLAQAKAQNKSWLKNVRGMVSLGGVVFGSALADDVIDNPKSPTAKLFVEFKVLLAKLTVVTDEMTTVSKIRYAGLNTLAWWNFLTRASQIQIDGAVNGATDVKTPSLAVKIQRVFKWVTQSTKSLQTGADPMAGLRLAITQAKNFGVLPSEQEFARLVPALTQGSVKDLIQLGPQMMRLLGADYNLNVKRFKKFGNAVVDGVTQLSTDERIQWWKNHAVPVENIRYYSVSATMDEPQSVLMANNQLGYNPNSPDDQMLGQNWLQFTQVALPQPLEGNLANDSQVTIYKTIFWPRLIAELNPANAGLQASPLAIFGTHHWGLALPVVNKIADFKKQNVLAKNPFPRAALLKSIALAIGHDIAQEPAK